LRRLRARGIRLDGCLVYPRVGIATRTGRISYREPALQSLPKADRLARLGPVVDGRQFVRADYREAEPRVLHAVLKHYGLVTWDPGEDLYRTLAGDQADRDQVKLLVNTLINGGRPSEELTGRLAEFVAIIDAYRARLAAVARTAGRVHTWTGRPILLDVDESNHGGKAVNRVVQGTAADIFNAAVLRVDAALEGLSAAVSFLLFDEVWVECDPAAVPQVVDVLRREMEAAAQAVGVTVPVRIEQDAVVVDEPSLDLVLQEIAQERAAIMEFDGGLPRAIAERLAGAEPLPVSEDLFSFPWETDR
jgi:DNA polymerase-1